MKKNLCFTFIVSLFTSPAVMAVVIDLNDVIVFDQGGGQFLYAWQIPGTDIDQIEPGGSYSVDLEF